MIKAEALALAAKRNAHKGRALWNKTWVVEQGERGEWSVKLVDSDALRLQRQAEAAKTIQRERLLAVVALANGDFVRFEQHADRAMHATIKAAMS